MPTLYITFRSQMVQDDTLYVSADVACYGVASGVSGVNVPFFNGPDAQTIRDGVTSVAITEVNSTLQDPPAQWDVVLFGGPV